MGSLSDEYKSEIQEIFGEIYRTCIDKDIRDFAKNTLSEELQKVLKTDSIKKEYSEIIRNVLEASQANKENDYENIKQIITGIIDDRMDNIIETINDKYKAINGNSFGIYKYMKHLLFISLALNILILLFLLIKL